MIGNPLLQSSGSSTDGSGKMKRRWNDDVEFRNQTKGEPVEQKRFINDTVRNDFHKRFLNKFILSDWVHDHTDLSLRLRCYMYRKLLGWGFD